MNEDLGILAYSELNKIQENMIQAAERLGRLSEEELKTEKEIIKEGNKKALKATQILEEEKKHLDILRRKQEMAKSIDKETGLTTSKAQLKYVKDELKILEKKKAIESKTLEDRLKAIAASEKNLKIAQEQKAVLEDQRENVKGKRKKKSYAKIDEAMGEQKSIISFESKNLSKQKKEYAEIIALTKKIENQKILVDKMTVQSTVSERNYTKEIKRQGKALRSETDVLNEKIKGLKLEEKGIKNNISALTALNAERKRSNKLISGSQKKINSFGKSMRDTMAHISIMKSFISQTAGTFNMVLDEVSKTEEAVFSFGIVTGKSVAQIKQLRTEMYELAGNSRYSAEELSQAAESVARTGRNLEESLKIIESTSKLAVASFEDLGTATNTVNKAMVAFGLSADSAGDVANTFHNAVIATPLDLAQLDDSLKQSASAFGAVLQQSTRSGAGLEQYKLQIVDTMTTLTGLQTMLGRTGSQAGTTLKMFMTKMTAMTASSKKAFDEQTAGMQFKGGAMEGQNVSADALSKLVQTDVDDALNELSRLYTDGVLTYDVLMKMVGTRHVAQIANTLQLVNGNIKAQKDLILTNKDLTEDSEKATQAWTNSIKKLRNQWKQMELAFSSFMDGVGSDFVDFLSTTLSLINKISDSETLGNVIFPMLAVGGTAKVGAKALAALGTKLTVAAEAGGALSGVLGSMGTGLSALAGPIGLAVVGIAALTAGIYGYKRAQELKSQKLLDLAKDELGTFDMQLKKLSAIQKLSDSSSISIATMLSNQTDAWDKSADGLDILYKGLVDVSTILEGMDTTFKINTSVEDMNNLTTELHKSIMNAISNIDLGVGIDKLGMSGLEGISKKASSITAPEIISDFSNKRSELQKFIDKAGKYDATSYFDPKTELSKKGGSQAYNKDKSAELQQFATASGLAGIDYASDKKEAQRLLDTYGKSIEDLGKKYDEYVKAISKKQNQLSQYVSKMNELISTTKQDTVKMNLDILDKAGYSWLEGSKELSGVLSQLKKDGIKIDPKDSKEDLRIKGIEAGERKFLSTYIQGQSKEDAKGIFKEIPEMYAKKDDGTKDTKISEAYISYIENNKKAIYDQIKASYKTSKAASDTLANDLSTLLKERDVMRKAYGIDDLKKKESTEGLVNEKDIAKLREYRDLIEKIGITSDASATATEETLKKELVIEAERKAEAAKNTERLTAAINKYNNEVKLIALSQQSKQYEDERKLMLSSSDDKNKIQEKIFKTERANLEQNYLKSLEATKVGTKERTNLTTEYNNNLYKLTTEEINFKKKALETNFSNVGKELSAIKSLETAKIEYRKEELNDKEKERELNREIINNSMAQLESELAVLDKKKSLGQIGSSDYTTESLQLEAKAFKLSTDKLKLENTMLTENKKYITELIALSEKSSEAEFGRLEAIYGNILPEYFKIGNAVNGIASTQREMTRVEEKDYENEHQRTLDIGKLKIELYEKETELLKAQMSVVEDALGKGLDIFDSLMSGEQMSVDKGAAKSAISSGLTALLFSGQNTSMVDTTKEDKAIIEAETTALNTQRNQTLSENKAYLEKMASGLDVDTYRNRLLQEQIRLLGEIANLDPEKVTPPEESETLVETKEVKDAKDKTKKSNDKVEKAEKDKDKKIKDSRKADGANLATMMKVLGGIGALASSFKANEMKEELEELNKKFDEQIDQLDTDIALSSTNAEKLQLETEKANTQAQQTKLNESAQQVAAIQGNTSAITQALMTQTMALVAASSGGEAGSGLGGMMSGLKGMGAKFLTSDTGSSMLGSLGVSDDTMIDWHSALTGGETAAKIPAGGVGGLEGAMGVAGGVTGAAGLGMAASDGIGMEDLSSLVSAGASAATLAGTSTAVSLGSSMGASAAMAGVAGAAAIMAPVAIAAYVVAGEMAKGAEVDAARDANKKLEEFEANQYEEMMVHIMEEQNKILSDIQSESLSVGFDEASKRALMSTPLNASSTELFRDEYVSGGWFSSGTWAMEAVSASVNLSDFGYSGVSSIDDTYGLMENMMTHLDELDKTLAETSRNAGGYTQRREWAQLYAEMEATTLLFEELRGVQKALVSGMDAMTQAFFGFEVLSLNKEGNLAQEGEQIAGYSAGAWQPRESILDSFLNDFLTAGQTVGETIGNVFMDGVMNAFLKNNTELNSLLTDLEKSFMDIGSAMVPTDQLKEAAYFEAFQTGDKVDETVFTDILNQLETADYGTKEQFEFLRKELESDNTDYETVYQGIEDMISNGTDFSDEIGDMIDTINKMEEVQDSIDDGMSDFIDQWIKAGGDFSDVISKMDNVLTDLSKIITDVVFTGDSSSGLSSLKKIFEDTIAPTLQKAITDAFAETTISFEEMFTNFTDKLVAGELSPEEIEKFISGIGGSFDAFEDPIGNYDKLKEMGMTDEMLQSILAYKKVMDEINDALYDQMNLNEQISEKQKQLNELVSEYKKSISEDGVIDIGDYDNTYSELIDEYAKLIAKKNELNEGLDDGFKDAVSNNGTGGIKKQIDELTDAKGEYQELKDFYSEEVSKRWSTSTDGVYVPITYYDEGTDKWFELDAKTGERVEVDGPRKEYQVNPGTTDHQTEARKAILAQKAKDMMDVIDAGVIELEDLMKDMDESFNSAMSENDIEYDPTKSVDEAIAEYDKMEEAYEDVVDKINKYATGDLELTDEEYNDLIKQFGDLSVELQELLYLYIVPNLDESELKPYFEDLYEDLLGQGYTDKEANEEIEGLINAIKSASMGTEEFRKKLEELGMTEEEVLDMIEKLKGGYTDLNKAIGELEAKLKEEESATRDFTKAWLDGILEGDYDTIKSELASQTTAMMDTMLESFNADSWESMGTSIGQNMASSILDSYAQELINNEDIKNMTSLLNDLMFENMDYIDTTGNLSMDMLWELSQQSQKMAVEMETERQKFEAAMSMFDYNADIRYDSLEKDINYQTSSTKESVYNVTMNNSFNIGTLVSTSADMEMFATAITPYIAEASKNIGAW